MKSVLSIVVFVVFSALVISSCKKGDTGTANVIYSPWYTASPWVKDTVFSVFGFRYDKPVPAITQQMLDTGAVLVFAKLIGYNALVWPTGAVGQLPISLTYQQGSLMTDTWSAQASTGNLRIRFVNDKNYYGVIANTHQFRYIVIPGGVKANGRQAQPTYEEICRKYNIPE
jgi:hypothetical protein